MKKRIAILFYCTAVLGCTIIKAQIKLPRLVRDSMILQRDTKVNIWGWASANEKVELSLNKKKYSTRADAAGNWKIVLPPTKAGGPYTIAITGKNKLVLSNVLFGDVWLCSGQSNMVHQMNIHDVRYAKDIAEANYPEIRQFWVPALTSLQGPQPDLPYGNWQPAVGENVRPFSAIAYFFAKKIYDEYHIPIGIINASVGGTLIEAWTSEEGLKDFAAMQTNIQKNKDTAYINSFSRGGNATVNRQPRQPQDKGLVSSPAWYQPDYIPKGWKNIAVPGYWEDQGIKDLNGVVWYRKEIDVPASMVGKTGRVFLGRIVDADVLYINGKQIGGSTYMYPQRRYALPADVLKAGKNIVVVKVTNNAGKGGFVPDKPYCLFAGTDTIDLKGYWQYKVGEVFVPRNGQGSGAGINPQNQPAALYNGMLAPLVNYSIRGIVWYQGESNTGNAKQYEKLQPALIEDWRSKWQEGAIPFLFVQLPNFMDASYTPSESQWAELREAQLKSLSVVNTGMSVAIDLGEWNDIHPDNKKDVGERLFLIAQKLSYGKDVVYSGPLFKDAAVNENRITITFTNTGSGLVSKDGDELREFAIAGADKKFVWAKAKIENDKIIVWSDEISNPLYVRYAWADNPDVNLYNKEGLPASAFRTDK